MLAHTSRTRPADLSWCTREFRNHVLHLDWPKVRVLNRRDSFPRLEMRISKDASDVIHRRGGAFVLVMMMSAFALTGRRVYGDGIQVHTPAAAAA